MVESNLTVAIPTYNRNDKLLENLAKLLPQIGGQCIIIIDNHSDIPVEETIGDLLSANKEVDIKIYRNKTNIGISANFLRCFEYCETEWMWILSDDDAPYENAIDIIESDLKTYPDFIFFNYASAMVEEAYPIRTAIRRQTYETKGMSDFINRFDSFANTIFISSGVYNVKLLLPNIRIGYIYGYSLAPHLATVIYSLNENGGCLFSNKKLVHFDPPASSDTWSTLTYCQVIMLLLEVPVLLSNNDFRILSDKISVWFMSDAAVYQEVNTLYNEGSLKSRYIFLQVIARTILRNRSLKQKLVLFYLLVVTAFPAFSVIKKLKRKGIAKTPLARI